ncbi:hypothetical protein C8R46DRAFT_1055427 [Mycena filopes]|nr:hypothetical protein C8R46DRAFT_1055427 [Mycena filopes]
MSGGRAGAVHEWGAAATGHARVCGCGEGGRVHAARAVHHLLRIVLLMLLLLLHIAHAIEELGRADAATAAVLLLLLVGLIIGREHRGVDPLVGKGRV